MTARAEERELVGEALRLLEVDRLVLAIHDASFPSEPDEDTGRGSPYTAGAGRFYRFLKDLGFGAVLLGPQGELSADNPSPYDGAVFSRCTTSIALAPLAHDPVWAGLLRPETLETIVTQRPQTPRGRTHHRYAHASVRRALDEAWIAFREKRRLDAPPPELARLTAGLEALRTRHARWLEQDTLYDRLSSQHGSGHFKDWPALDARLFAPLPGDESAAEARIRALRAEHAGAIEANAFRQFVVGEQHRALRGLLGSIGLELYGDLSIGFAPQDEWAQRSIMLAGYRMGAPPSRTNPEGQPWGYPVLDPAQWTGAAREFIRARMNGMFEAYDGVRIDHPHGLVDPWVYAASAPDPLAAVQRGARLRSSPDLHDHPALVPFAIPRPEQIDRRLPRHADRWVNALEPAQVDQYAVLFDAIVESARAERHGAGSLFCEVLSTLPAPLEAVLVRHGLGRFRVTQKANLEDPRDVYRSENAEPADWIMMGTHDTPPMWLLVEKWRAEGKIAAQAAYLAERLSLGDAGALARDPGLLVNAKLADALASRARSAMIFFADLLGLRETYNVPGTISDDNWSLRVPEGWEAEYFDKRARGEALDLRRALGMALRAAARGATGDLATLADRLSALP
ncbi:4-alpha-glucanotransferase [Polyangium aurulentum]|uniref:4-alpha-glucanotransferase n=1 Tax=Polyangium aurulentum TaxID=2567896 RepID=UPI00146CFCD9|nr:4-alpha-glucanotransferase [Polyangium aurulentum]UQA60962.1 4-alpha-glucanotransferase [Polyangium aurulentum]